MKICKNIESIIENLAIEFQIDIDIRSECYNDHDYNTVRKRKKKIF